MKEVECPHCYVMVEVFETAEFCLCPWCDEEFEIEQEN